MQATFHSAGQRKKAFKFPAGITRFNFSEGDRIENDEVHYDGIYSICTSRSEDPKYRDPSERCALSEAGNANKSRYGSCITVYQMEMMSQTVALRGEFWTYGWERYQSILQHLNALMAQNGGKPVDIRMMDFSFNCTDTKFQKGELSIVMGPPGTGLQPPLWQKDDQTRAAWTQIVEAFKVQDRALGLYLPYEAQVQRLQGKSAQASGQAYGGGFQPPSGPVEPPTMASMGGNFAGVQFAPPPSFQQPGFPQPSAPPPGMFGAQHGIGMPQQPLQFAGGGGAPQQTGYGHGNVMAPGFPQSTAGYLATGQGMPQQSAPVPVAGVPSGIPPVTADTNLNELLEQVKRNAANGGVPRG